MLPISYNFTERNEFAIVCTDRRIDMVDLSDFSSTNIINLDGFADVSYAINSVDFSYKDNTLFWTNEDIEDRRVYRSIKVNKSLFF